MFSKRFLCLFVLGMASCARLEPSAEQAPAATKPKRPQIDKASAVEVTPRALFEAYADDAGDTSKQYTDKAVKVEGKVKATSSHEGKPCLHLYVPVLNGSVFIRCAFDPARASDMADVKPGGDVTILGRCVGPVEGFITLDDSTVLRYRPPKD